MSCKGVCATLGGVWASINSCVGLWRPDPDSEPTWKVGLELTKSGWLERGEGEAFWGVGRVERGQTGPERGSREDLAFMLDPNPWLCQFCVGHSELRQQLCWSSSKWP